MTVYLVGAGPGDPGLLTVRGRDVLARCDVVLYDALVDRRILAIARPGTRCIDVGKRARGTTAAYHAAAQEHINALLIEYGRAADCVVRLKGGDPFVFGRGGEEALALAAARIPFEVVPGVSSAVAVPAYAGIPVTHRGLSSSVAVVTGHQAAGALRDGARTAVPAAWQSPLAPAADTLVVLMGLGRLAEIAQGLIEQGRSPHTPAAVIEHGTTPLQRVVSGALVDLPALAAAAEVRAPALIVIGNVVSLRSQIDWFACGQDTAGPAAYRAAGDGTGDGTGDRAAEERVRCA